MLRVGLTGGTGSGKSTVAAMLADLGAVVVDADRLAREVLAVGTPGLAEVVEAFGADVLAPDGSLDRAALARIVFADPALLARLESITHPRIAAATASLVRDLPSGTVLVHDVPLLVEKGLAGGYDVVVVVGAPLKVRLSRLAARGMAEDDARARIAAQADDEQRRAVADVWIDNDGTVDHLREQVQALWSGPLQRRPSRS